MVFGLFRGPAQQPQAGLAALAGASALQTIGPDSAGARELHASAHFDGPSALSSTFLAAQAQPAAPASDDQLAPGLTGLLAQASALGADVSSIGAAPPKGRRALVPFAVNRKTIKACLADRQTACISMACSVDAPADVIFDLLADPHKHAAIFDSIQSADASLLSEDGPRRKWRLDYVAAWRFWKVGGVCQNRLWMETDRDAGTVTFRLREPGFLRTYEGTWTIKGPSGAGPNALSRPPSPSPSLSGGSSTSSLTESLSPSPPASLVKANRHLGLFAAINNPLVSTLHDALSSPDSSTPASPTCSPSLSVPSLPRFPASIAVSKTMSPKISPPFPLNHTLKVQASSQVEDMLHGLLMATAQTLDGTFGVAGKAH